MAETTHIVLCGCGKMGQAMLRGWLERSSAAKLDRITVIDPMIDKIEGLPQDARIDYRAGADPSAQASAPTLIFLSAKPQDMADAIAGVAPLAGADTAWLSIAAGLSTAWLGEHIPDGKQIIRAMPNTPASIGMGVTAICGHADTLPENMALARSLMEAVGCVILLDEALMDAVTAVSGSGPAYIFAMQEAMEAAAIALGFEKETARVLTLETMRGATELMARSGEEPSLLRQNVSSPGGTTLAALEHLIAEKGGLDELMENAIKAAAQRSRELGQ